MKTMAREEFINEAASVRNEKHLIRVHRHDKDQDALVLAKITSVDGNLLALRSDADGKPIRIDLSGLEFQVIGERSWRLRERDQVGSWVIVDVEHQYNRFPL